METDLNTELGIELILKKSKKDQYMDWRPEALRVPAIFIIVVGHMLMFTGWLTNDARHPLVWLGGAAIIIFMACAGYVHGLKDEFNTHGSLTVRNYLKFFKGRFLRLYIGYYLALIVVLIAKLNAGYSIHFSTTEPLIFGHSNPILITPTSLVLELSCTWPIFTLNIGGIWPEGWFICAMMFLSLMYPLLRRIYSINKYYLYFIIVITLIARFITIIFINANYAFYFPFAWMAEFSLGIIIGANICKKGGVSPPNKSYQRSIISAASRVWPFYLFHMAPVVFMPKLAPIEWFVLMIIPIIGLAEIFHRILTIINKLIGVRTKKVHRVDMP